MGGRGWKHGSLSGRSPHLELAFRRHSADDFFGDESPVAWRCIQRQGKFAAVFPMFRHCVEGKPCASLIVCINQFDMKAMGGQLLGSDLQRIRETDAVVDISFDGTSIDILLHELIDGGHRSRTLYNLSLF